MKAYLSLCHDTSVHCKLLYTTQLKDLALQVLSINKLTRGWSGNELLSAHMHHLCIAGSLQIPLDSQVLMDLAYRPSSASMSSPGGGPTTSC